MIAYLYRRAHALRLPSRYFWGPLLMGRGFVYSLCHYITFLSGDRNDE